MHSPVRKDWSDPKKSCVISWPRIDFSTLDPVKVCRFLFFFFHSFAVRKWVFESDSADGVSRTFHNRQARMKRSPPLAVGWMKSRLICRSVYSGNVPHQRYFPAIKKPTGRLSQANSTGCRSVVAPYGENSNGFGRVFTTLP